jgi:hypothetical protein
MRRKNLELTRFGCVSLLIAAAMLTAPFAFAAEDAPEVQLNTSKAAPRAMEPLTERAILRDYKFAWYNLELAIESNSTARLNALFVGPANKWIHDAVDSQRRNGLSSRYLNQTHKVDAVFYSPEGDVLELHDTAGYDFQVLDGSKTIHDEHVTVHYVVLMTPGADRWVIRDIQAVPQF